MLLRWSETGQETTYTMKKIVWFSMEVALLSFHKQALEISVVFISKTVRKYFKIL